LGQASRLLDVVFAFEEKEGWKEKERRQTIISQFYRGLLAFVGSLPFSSRLVQNVQAKGDRGPFLSQ
jgi:hypothetical protein